MLCWNRISQEGGLQKETLVCNRRVGFDNSWVLSSSGSSVILWRCPFLTMKYLFQQGPCPSADSAMVVTSCAV